MVGVVLCALVILIAIGVLMIIGGVRPGLLKMKDLNTRSAEAFDQGQIVEGIATWTENLRDTIAASAGLEQAIFATENFAPRAIAEPVRRLVAGLRYGTFEDALRRFADDVAHPTCDFVVAALITASVHQTRDLAQLLTHLSECARSECHLYMRIWVSRARMRTAIRIISGAVTTFVVGLLAFNTAYLKPFLTVEGIFVMTCIASAFAFALLSLHKLSNIRVPARFLAGRRVSESV
jgi:tight adherence protein B